MLAPIPPKRRDGGSSFADLKRYLVEEAEQTLDLEHEIEEPERLHADHELTALIEKELDHEREHSDSGLGFDRYSGVDFSDSSRLRTLRQSYARAVAEEPEAQSLNSVRSLSGVGVVGFRKSSEVLLPGHALGDMEHGGSNTDPALRRGSDGERTAGNRRGHVDRDTGEIVRYRGDYLLSDNLLSLETADAEMKATAAENPRCKDPVYHYIIAWQEGEKPSREQWEAATKKTLDDLGFSEHQYLAVVHDDTDHFHAHVMVNRVHPETGKAHYPQFSKRTLDQSMREIEAAQGWKESRGLYRWDDEAGKAVKTEPELLAQYREEREQKRQELATGKAAKMEIYGNAESLQAYCKAQPAKDVKATLQRDGASWDDLHATLKKHGLEIQAGEKGGYTIKAIDQDVAVKASDVFRDTFAGKANREKLAEKLGPYHPPSRFVKAIDTEKAYSQHREPAKRETKRDPEKRAIQREARAQARQQLRGEYDAYKKGFTKKRGPDKDEAKRRYQALSAEIKTKRQEIRRSTLPPELKKAALSVAAMEAVKSRAELRAQMAAERAEATKPQSYREWVADRAVEGNDAAISQLRGFDYADKRRQKEREKEEAEQAQANAIRLAQPGQLDPIARHIDGVTWRVNRRTGDVTYQVAGKDAFTDHGSRLVMAHKASDHQSLEVALKLAQQKYGNTLALTGTDEFKRQCVETAVKARMAVTFNDPAMNALKQQLEQQRAQEKARARENEPTRGNDGPKRGRGGLGL